MEKKRNISSLSGCLTGRGHVRVHLEEHVRPPLPDDQDYVDPRQQGNDNDNYNDSGDDDNDSGVGDDNDNVSGDNDDDINTGDNDGDDDNDSGDDDNYIGDNANHYYVRSGGAWTGGATGDVILSTSGLVYLKNLVGNITSPVVLLAAPVQAPPLQT